MADPEVIVRMVDRGIVRICYRFDRFALEPDRRMLTAGGSTVPLSSRGFDILQLLIEQRHRVVTKDEILDKVWCGNAVEENNLAVQVSALRRALGADGRSFVATVPGRGYRFVAEVIARDDPVLDTNALSLAEVAPVSTTAATRPSVLPCHDGDRAASALPPARWRRLSAWLLLALVALAAMAVPRWLAGQLSAPRLSVVVLPFRSLSDDAGQDYLADAISDDLTTDLSHLPGSTVIARESADTYKGRAVRAEAIGRALDVRYFLEGSLRREGHVLHINAQLIDTVRATHLWAIAFDVPRDGVDSAREIIVRRLASALDFTLVQIESARSLHERPRNPDAVDLFLRARSILDRDDTLAGLVAGEGLLEQAVVAAPNFSDARAQLGLVLLRKIANFDDPDEWADHARAITMVSEAMNAAPHDPLAITASGMLSWVDHQCEQALSSFTLALSLDPDDMEARDGLARCSRDLGRMEEMIHGLQDILRIDPAAPGNAARQNLIGLGELLLGRPAEAIDWLNRARARARDHHGQPPALGWEEWNWINLIVAKWELGDAAGARDLYATYSELWPHRTVWRLAAFYTPDIVRLPGFTAYLVALEAVGMPRAADEHSDLGVAPSATERNGGDFEPTPLRLPGAATIDTAALRTRLSGADRPVVLDVGRGAALPRGAVLVWPEGLWGDQNLLLETSALQNASPGEHPNGAVAKARDIVVMGDGTFGWSSYNAALLLVADHYEHVLWYRGGEEAWAETGLPSRDLRR